MSENRVELKTVDITIAGCLYQAVVFYEKVDGNIKIWAEFIAPERVVRKFLFNTKPYNNDQISIEVLVDQIFIYIREHILHDIQKSIDTERIEFNDDMFNKLKGVLQ